MQASQINTFMSGEELTGNQTIHQIHLQTTDNRAEFGYLSILLLILCRSFRRL